MVHFGRLGAPSGFGQSFTIPPEMLAKMKEAQSKAPFFTTGPCPAGFNKVGIGSKSEACVPSASSLLTPADVGTDGAKSPFVAQLDRFWGANKVAILGGAAALGVVGFLLLKKRR